MRIWGIVGPGEEAFGTVVVVREEREEEVGEGGDGS